RVAGDKLWVAVPDALKLAAIDLQRGLYDIDNTVRTVDFSRNEVRPESFEIENDLLLVSTGESGSVVAYAIRANGATEPVGHLGLTHLVSGSGLHAGKMVRSGQTLYVAGG